MEKLAAAYRALPIAEAHAPAEKAPPQKVVSAGNSYAGNYPPAW